MRVLMNETSEPSTDVPHPDITLRPERDGDELFLAEVYASTRQDELNLTNWDAVTRRAFLDMQFRAMLKGYRASYPQAQFSIILLDATPVGRIVVDRLAGEIRVVDVACVFHGTRAIAFYQRLDFHTVSEPGIYEEMEWNPPA
jgi:hypothetical protein